MALDQTTIDKLLETLKKGLKDVNSLTDSDKDFLRARQSYISQKHIDALASVFSKKEAKKSQKKAEEEQIAKEEKVKQDQVEFDGQQDPHQEEEVKIENTEDADEEDRKIYYDFVVCGLLEIENELYDEFVKAGYIKKEEFDKYYKEIKKEWLEFPEKEEKGKKKAEISDGMIKF